MFEDKQVFDKVIIKILNKDAASTGIDQEVLTFYLVTSSNSLQLRIQIEHICFSTNAAHIHDTPQGILMKQNGKHHVAM